MEINIPNSKGLSFETFPEAVKAGDLFPYKISFLGRKIQIQDIQFPEDDDVCTFYYDVLEGENLTEDESAVFGGHILDIIYEATINIQLEDDELVAVRGTD